MTNPADITQIKRVLDFWFVELAPEQKFTKDPELDAQIKQRFEPVYWTIVNGETEAWRATPEGRLAEIIVLDQFARNMFRDDPQSFAADDLALDLTQQMLTLGLDQHLSYEQRQFVYMPLMHSESVAVHEQAVQVFEAYGNGMTLRYEHKHKDIIDRFGRYPHRNAVLGRTSTPEEIEFLKEHSGF
jgi:uncharacterized protein (DUF924 family)